MEIKRIRDLGRQIRNRRKEVGLTADYVADLAGVSRRLLLELEQGKRTNVGLSKLLRIIETLGLTLDLNLRGFPHTRSQTG